ncbi:MAG: hypothetical protein OXI25_07885 [Chloroflexota bacterium]|nr:hypothetical protein [Chloroflexota bacterium]
MEAVAKFGVGGSGDYRSAVWSLGVDGENAWLAAKPAGAWWLLTVRPDACGLLTLHDDGGPTLPRSGGNLVRRWRPPGPARMSWSHGFTLIVPTLGAMEARSRADVDTGDGVLWSAPAPIDHAVVFALRSAEAAKGETLAVLRLPGGEKALTRAYQPVPAALMDYFRRAMRFAPEADGGVGSLVHYDTGGGHEALFFDLPLHSPR